MTAIALVVNARTVEAIVEPRTHLADFLRDGLHLTGTHLGCEHGVCGACTLLLDDMPARACITYAVACDGARVTTIEGLDDDEITIALRAAFTREHALQCGYCTPGMLIAARDLVRRLPEPDECSIRVGLSGNLCRCTGYVGIVRAVGSVIDERRARGVAAEPGGGRTALGPVGSGNRGDRFRAAMTTRPVAMAEPRSVDTAEIAIPDFTPARTFDARFSVGHSPARVFELLGNVAAVADCLPGVSLSAAPAPDRAEGALRVRIGPIVANFRGAARIERSPETLAGRIIGVGTDRRSRSSTQGEIRYRVVPAEHGSSTQVEVSIGYSLRGMLAQIAREGVVRDLVARLTAEFAGNLDRLLSGAASGSAKPTALNGLALLADILLQHARKLLWRGRGRPDDKI